MDKKKIIAALALMILSVAAFGQDKEKEPFVKQYLLRTQGNLSFGYLTKLKLVPIYVAGDFDFYLDERVSLFGEGAFFLATNEDTKFIKHNHTLLGGMNYHLTKNNRFDPYIGFNPGVIIGQYRVEDPANIGTFRETKVGVIPVFSPCIGFNYHIGSIFNFFVRARYIQAQFFGTSPTRVPVSELRISAGLGWTWNFFQKKK